MMKSFLFVFISFLGYIEFDSVNCSRCSNRASIAFVVPMSTRRSSEVIYLEELLLELVNYFEISNFDFKIKVVEYNRTHRAISDFLTNRKVANTEISSIGQKRERFKSFSIYLKPVLEDTFKSLEVTSEMYRKKVVLVFLNGSVLDKTAALQYATRLKDNGYVIYVVTSYMDNFDVAMNLASDPCKTHMVSDFKSGMDNMINDIGNNMCLASNPSLEVTSGPDTLGNCNNGNRYKPPERKFHFYCQSDGLFPDQLNCAYFYKCTYGQSVHLKCQDGNMFDANTNICNHKMSVTCYTGVTCPESIGLFPFPGDCYKFLNCFHWMPYVQSCPYGLVFDKIVKRCLLPIHALC